MKTFLKRALTAPHSFMPVTVARKMIRQVNFKHQSSHNAKQLLVDISEVIRHDARTGIQRVVRGILLQLLNNPPEGYVVRPVFASVTHGYRYAEITDKCLQADESARAQAQSVVVCNGDIFLGLDLAAHLLPRHQDELARWKRRGVRLAFLIYDILPVLHPHWFNPKRSKTFAKWLRTLAIHADDLFCISNVVKSDVLSWFSSRYGIKTGVIRLHTIPLGADIDATMPSTGLALHHQAILAKMEDVPSVLMVGTLEPRKGHGHVLDAFELLWKQGQDINLVIAGRSGWKTEPLQIRLRSNSELNRHLFWLDDASDEMVQRLYETCSGVIVASEAEGFGLPLLEASYYGKPVMARDIPVFREIAGPSVTYFSGNSPDSLAGFLHEWIIKICKQSVLQAQHCFHRNDWRTSSNELIHCLQHTYL